MRIDDIAYCSYVSFKH